MTKRSIPISAVTIREIEEQRPCHGEYAAFLRSIQSNPDDPNRYEHRTGALVVKPTDHLLPPLTPVMEALVEYARANPIDVGKKGTPGRGKNEFPWTIRNHHYLVVPPDLDGYTQEQLRELAGVETGATMESTYNKGHAKGELWMFRLFPTRPKYFTRSALILRDIAKLMLDKQWAEVNRLYQTLPRYAQYRRHWRVQAALVPGTKFQPRPAKRPPALLRQIPGPKLGPIRKTLDSRLKSR